MDIIHILLIHVYRLYIVHYIPSLTDSLVVLGTVLLVNLVDFILADLLVPLTVLPRSSGLRSSVAAVDRNTFMSVLFLDNLYSGTSISIMPFNMPGAL